jgi:hypothetical protein
MSKKKSKFYQVQQQLTLTNKHKPDLLHRVLIKNDGKLNLRKTQNKISEKYCGTICC